MKDIKSETILAFFHPAKRGRYLALPASAKKRKSLLDSLNHLTHLDPRYSTPISQPEQVQSVLESNGAPIHGHLISSDSGLDGRELPLNQALSLIEDTLRGTIVCCVPGRLAYDYDESGLNRVLLKR